VTFFVKINWNILFLLNSLACRQWHQCVSASDKTHHTRKAGNVKGFLFPASSGSFLLLPAEDRRKFCFGVAKIDTNWFLCFGVAKIDTNLLEKPGKVRRDRVSAGERAGNQEMGRKVDCAVQHITNGRDE